MRLLPAFFLAVLATSASALAADLPRILLYTRNGLTLEGKKGYVHDNIPNSIAAIRELGATHGFAVDVSEDPQSFTLANLRKYRAIVLSNTNNQMIETEEQKAALQAYLRGGGGLAGIHSACGSMRSWPWFWAMIGGSFVRHPKLQEFTVHVVDRQHPSTRHLGATWKVIDEFYYLRDMPQDLSVLLQGDLTTLDDPKKPAGTRHPLAWYHTFEGGRCWYTSLGHRKEVYNDPAFRQHLLGGILWAMGAPDRAK
jgi:type 1 glutamine amidotransferase